MLTARPDEPSNFDSPAQRWNAQMRTYRRSVELYHEAMRRAVEALARARVRRGLPTVPADRPDPAAQRVVVALPVVAYRAPETRIVDDPLLPLSGRELEVARLVARGASNDEIARALVITSGTAANHIARIMRKLGVRSRTGIGVWAVERGLTAESA